MIWNNAFIGSARSSRVADILAGEFENICGEISLPLDSTVESVTSAIADAICQSPSDVRLDRATLIGFAAQALYAIGESNAARRLFLFGNGVVRPTSWDTKPGQTVWLLEVRRLWEAPGLWLDLAVVQAAQKVLQTIADIWDDSSGRGVLGLLPPGGRHIPKGGAPLATLPSTSEIAACCRQKLDHIRQEREWVETPDVVYAAHV